MTVKEVFDLRKQGKIEEAYEAIRPMYAAHKGKFTTLCMFWTACDVFKLRLEQNRVEEAEKIYKALERLVPSIEDDQEHKAEGFMHYAESRLIKTSEKFRKRYFAIKRAKAHAEGSKSPAALASQLEETESTRNEGLNIPSDNPSEPSEALNNSCNPSNSCSTELNAGQQAVLECIKENAGFRVPRLSDLTGIPAKSIERHVKALTERGLITFRGSKKSGGYYVVSM